MTARWAPLVLVVALSACGGDKAPRATPAAWCRLDVGMTASQARAIMGDPAEDFTGARRVAGFEPQFVWRQGPYEFTTFFNAVGRVRSLQVNDLSLSAAQRKALPCPLNRSVP